MGKNLCFGIGCSFRGFYGEPPMKTLGWRAKPDNMRIVSPEVGTAAVRYLRGPERGGRVNDPVRLFTVSRRHNGVSTLFTDHTRSMVSALMIGIGIWDTINKPVFIPTLSLPSPVPTQIGAYNEQLHWRTDYALRG